jgi:hypothetical protein
MSFECRAEQNVFVQLDQYLWKQAGWQAAMRDRARSSGADGSASQKRSMYQITHDRCLAQPAPCEKRKLQLRADSASRFAIQGLRAAHSLVIATECMQPNRTIPLWRQP